MPTLQALLLAVSTAAGGSPPPSALDAAFQAGAPAAPIELELFLSLDEARQCELLAALQREVDAGRLRGKVRLVFRPLPAADGDETVVRALVAAAGQGRLWAYVQHLSRAPDPRRACAPRACSAGLDADSFGLGCGSAEAEAFLAASRRSSARAGVTSPCALLGGRKLAAGFSAERLIEELLAELQRSARRAP